MTRFQRLLKVVAFELLVSHLLDPHLSLLARELEVESGEICPQLCSDGRLHFLPLLSHASWLLVHLVVRVVIVRIVRVVMRVIMRVVVRVIVRMVVRVVM
jgi:hypothetical protein